MGITFEIWEIFCYYFVEYITYTFGLQFSFFNAHDEQVWSFNGIAEFFMFILQLLSFLSKDSSVLSLISILPLSPEILSFACSSLLEWLSTSLFI
jgi:hypothetical protein